MECDLCHHAVDNNPAIFAEINDLVHTEELPEGAYNTIVERLCTTGCPAE